MKRSSGVLMHISSLWGDYSVGSFGEEALEFIDFLSESGFKSWQVLPFCLPDSCNSPYKSYSAFSGNPFFIDLPTLNKEGLITDDELEGAKQKTPYACEFERLKDERLALLSLAAERFDDDKAIDEFFLTHKNTEQFCTFMALKASNGGTEWTKWQNDVPDAKTLKLWRFTQYTFFKQWKRVKDYANGKGVSVIGDIPIYVSLDSSDVWADPSQFQLDERYDPTSVAGVPPDYFSEDGQLWGNPLYNWKKMKADGFTWWKARMSFMTELFDGVRIDHFRGIESYYSISAGSDTAKNGKWVKGPGMAFVKAMKEVCGDKLIIAEDLGVITDKVAKLVHDSEFPGMRVLQFAFLGDENSPHLPHNYPNNSVAYTGTHDNNTLLGYIWELDPENRKRLFDYCGYVGNDWDNSYESIMRTMFSSHAGLLILPIQDILFYGKDTRFNTPGSADGNWSYRVTRAQLDKIDRNRIAKWNKTYGRS